MVSEEKEARPRTAKKRKQNLGKGSKTAAREEGRRRQRWRRRKQDIDLATEKKEAKWEATAKVGSAPNSNKKRRQRRSVFDGRGGEDSGGRRRKQGDASNTATMKTMNVLKINWFLCNFPHFLQNKKV